MTQATMNWDTLRAEQAGEIDVYDFTSMTPRSRCDLLYRGCDAKLFERYKQWVISDSSIFGRFMARCDAMWAKGWRHYSQWAIAGVMRYHHDLEKGPGQQFKIPNGFIGFMARDYIIANPEKFGFFTLRKLGGR